VEQLIFDKLIHSVSGNPPACPSLRPSTSTGYIDLRRDQHTPISSAEDKIVSPSPSRPGNMLFTMYQRKPLSDAPSIQLPGPGYQKIHTSVPQRDFSYLGSKNSCLDSSIWLTTTSYSVPTTYYLQIDSHLHSILVWSSGAARARFNRSRQAAQGEASSSPKPTTKSLRVRANMEPVAG